MLKERNEYSKALFGDIFKDSLIFHIPHASTYLPFTNGYNMDLVENEINLLTDWATDKIFDVAGTKQLIAPFSRIFCDVERFEDDFEELYKVGRGFFYTHTDTGEILREDIQDSKKNIFEKYYKKHHETFENMVQATLDTNNFSIIIDCHSFTNTPFKTDVDQSLDRPDICIGTDDFHTPNWLTNTLISSFDRYGFSSKVNSPYSGTIVPLKFYKKNDSVHSVMIEINRNLYMENNQVIPEKVLELNKIMTEIFENSF
jgi:N-formylglutamate deformylase